MCDRDELAGAFTEAFAAQMRSAVLGHDVVNVVLAGGADSTRGKDGLYLADSAALGRGGEGDKALAALGLACAAHIVDLAAGAGHMLGADGFGADLAEEVDLKSCVYRDHIVVLAYDLGVIDVVDGQDLNAGVIVDEVIYPLGAVGKGGDRLAAVDLLFGVVDGSAA